MINRFVITGLPRTRTAWFSAYLTQGDTICYHEATFNNDDMNLQGYTNIGTADSGYVLSRKWVEQLGEHKLVVVHRDLKEVEKSLTKIGLKDGNWLLGCMAERLATLPGLHIDFCDVNKRLEEIHDYLNIPGYDMERAALFANLNIQSQDWRA